MVTRDEARKIGADELWIFESDNTCHECRLRSLRFAAAREFENIAREVQRTSLAYLGGGASGVFGVVQSTR